MGDMSSNKRRKVGAPDAPSSPMSAISALAARRRLASSAIPEDVTSSPLSSPSPAPEETTPSGVNSFEALRALKNNRGPTKVSKISASVASPGRDRLATPVSATGGKQRFGTPECSSRLQQADDARPSLKSKVSTPDSSIIQSQTVFHSSFRLTKQNCRINAAGVTELRLSDGERFLVLGSFGVRVLAGQLTVTGATIRPSDTIHWIHAPQCHAIPVIRTVEKTRLELHDDPSIYTLRQLERLSPLFRKLWNEEASEHVKEASPDRKSTFQILCTSEDAPKGSVIQELLSPPEWNMTLASLVTAALKNCPRTILISGPKSAGKSTFSKLLTNRLLAGAPASSASTSQSQPTGVAILDLDPGQPEYAPSGTLSLVHVLQPNLEVAFTHPSFNGSAFKVIRSHSLASVTPASAPDLYLKCAMDLFSTYQKTLENTVLIINTPGWILGTGLDLLAEIITHTVPADVLYMSEEGPADTVEVLRGVTKGTFTTVPSQQSEFASRTAAHFRAMQMMSYFHSQPTNSIEAPKLDWNPASISSIPPRILRYSGPHCGILGILSYDCQSPPDLLAGTINGMVLAAVEIESSEALRDIIAMDSPDTISLDTTKAVSGLNVSSDFTVARTPEDLPFIPNPQGLALDPRHSHTVGLVLIRGIDTATKSLQTITPIPSQRIAEIKALGRNIVLVHGKFDTPTWAYAEDLYGQSTNGQGGSKDIQITDEDTSEDDSEVEPEHVENAGDVAAIPWVEVLKGNQKRPVGSKVWRVRRDLGRNSGD